MGIAVLGTLKYYHAMSDILFLLACATVACAMPTQATPMQASLASHESDSQGSEMSEGSVELDVRRAVKESSTHVRDAMMTQVAVDAQSLSSQTDVPDARVLVQRFESLTISQVKQMGYKVDITFPGSWVTTPASRCLTKCGQPLGHGTAGTVTCATTSGCSDGTKPSTPQCDATPACGTWTAADPTNCATACGTSEGSGNDGAVSCSTGNDSGCDADTKPPAKKCPATEACKTKKTTYSKLMDCWFNDPNHSWNWIGDWNSVVTVNDDAKAVCEKVCDEDDECIGYALHPVKQWCKLDYKSKAVCKAACLRNTAGLFNTNQCHLVCYDYGTFVESDYDPARVAAGTGCVNDASATLTMKKTITWE